MGDFLPLLLGAPAQATRFHDATRCIEHSKMLKHAYEARSVAEPVCAGAFMSSLSFRGMLSRTQFKASENIKSAPPADQICKIGAIA